MLHQYLYTVKPAFDEFIAPVGPANRHCLELYQYRLVLPLLLSLSLSHSFTHSPRWCALCALTAD